MTRDDGDNEETFLATRNAIKLGGSLLLTWGIALAVRLLLPRYLGPVRLGELSFADAFATTFFVALGLGVDVYVRKQVAVRPAHASDFMGGTFALRMVLSCAIVAVVAVVMNATEQPPPVQRLVYLFAAVQFFVHANTTLSALLHAKGNVDGVAIFAVMTKIAWALGVLAAIVTGAGLWAIAASYLIAEVLKCASLLTLARRHLGLIFRLDVAATKAMLLYSLPYYLNAFATTAYGKLDVTLLAFLGTSREVGWYAAASSVAGITLLATPLIGWVLMPTFARAAARSQQEFFARIRRSTDLVLGVGIPVSLFMCLGADFCVQIAFGEAFAPAALALRILSLTFVVTYVAMIYAITLLMLDRAWTLTAISMAGLIVNLILNPLLVPWSMRVFGEGGGGAGCALAMLGTELSVTSAMVVIVGRQSFDRRTFEVVIKSLAACLLAVVVDRFSLGIGLLRFFFDVLAYAVVVISTGALNTKEIASIVTAAFRRKTALSTPIRASEEAPGAG